jgi:hypothetical protein
MDENPESQSTKQPARSLSKQHQEAVLLQLRELKDTLGEQQQAQEKLRSELTEQAKRQQEQIEHRIQEIEKILPQHQQERNQLLQAMTAASVQQPQASVNLPPRKRAWTGFAGKTLWDWLTIVLIPLMIFVFTIAVTAQQQQIATDQQQESILDTYQKDIAGLILSQPLDTSPQGAKGRLAARAYTIEAILRLDLVRKSRLIQFLYGARLLQTDHPVVDLSQADLSQVSLSKLDLHRINLSGAILRGADFRQTNLSGAYLQGVDLREAKLDNGTNLSGAYLWQADLEGLDLRLTILQGADLKDAKVQGTIIPPEISPPPSSACINSGSDLGDDTSKWMPSLPPDNKAQQVIGQVDEPSFDGKTLQIFNPGGGQFTNIAASYSLNQTSTGQTLPLHLSLCFYLPDLTPVQVFAFSVNRWSGNRRYEMTLQYEAVGDGTPQQGTPPTWRIWTGQNEQPTPAGQQPLSEGRWHWLDLKGETGNRQITYTSFTLNGKTYSLNQSFPAVSPPSPTVVPDSLNIVVQLGGDAKGDPYSIYIDDVNLNS